MKRAFSNKALISSLSFSLLLSPVSSSIAAAESPKAKNEESAEKKDEKGTAISPDKIKKVLESEDIFGEQFKVSSYLQGDEIVVQTWQDPRSTDPDHDYRIHSVLIAKKLQDAFPDSLKTCKVRYFDRLDFKRYQEFTVVPGLVKAFVAGIIPEKELLTTLPMRIVDGNKASSDTEAKVTDNEKGATKTSSVDASATSRAASATSSQTVTIAHASSSANNSISSTAAASTVAASAVAKAAPIDPNSLIAVLPGYEQASRADLLRRIQDLEKKGVKSPARQMLVSIEESVRDGRESEAKVNIDRLKSSIDGMEKSYQKAKATKANTSSPVTVRQGSAPGAGSASRSSSGTSDTEFAEGIAVYKKKMGDFYPHYGPLYVDRFNIGNQIMKMQSGGQNVEKFRAPYLQMEATVVNGGSGLEQQIKKFNELLNLIEAPRDEEYKYQQKIADQRKGQDK
jgi:hypothetical protein